MDLPAATVEQLGQLGAAAVWLFGSQVAGTAHAGSDTDVAVLLRADAGSPSLRERGRLSEVLADALEQPEIDLVMLDEAPLEVRAAAIREGRLLAQPDPPRRVRFEVDTLSRWFDLREATAGQDRAYLARVAREGLT